MKLYIVTIISILGLIIVGSSVVRAATVIPAPTPPDKPGFAKDLDTQPKTIKVSCPNTIQIGPVHVPSGWQSLGTLDRQRVHIAIDKQERKVVCWYSITGGEDITAPFISQPLPAGYDCTIPYPKEYAAICTKGIRVPR